MFAPPPPTPPVVPATQPALLDKNESRKPGNNLTQGLEFSEPDMELLPSRHMVLSRLLLLALGLRYGIDTLLLLSFKISFRC